MEKVDRRIPIFNANALEARKFFIPVAKSGERAGIVEAVNRLPGANL
jgi:hypothetical protein